MTIDSVYRNAAAAEVDIPQDQEEPTVVPDIGLSSTTESPDPFENLTRAFIRLNNLPTSPLDRLTRYEAALWRQACQILWTLQCLGRRKPWGLRIR
jgi:hypothetical protein